MVGFPKLMKIFKKILFKKIDYNKNYSCLVCGPDTTYYRKCFEDNFLWVDNNHIIYDKKLILKSLITFFKVFSILKFSYQNFRLAITLSFLIPIIIKLKKIKIVCFLDYSLIGKTLKIFFKDKVTLIGFQNSMRDIRVDRKKEISNFDYYFQWDHFMNKKSLKNCKLVNFGSLKSHIVLEKYKKWSLINKDYSKVKNIILISSFGPLNLNLEKRYFNGLSKDEKIKKAEKLYKDFISKKIHIKFHDLQALEFFLLCNDLNKILGRLNLKLIILSRYEKSKINIMEKSILRFNAENKFYKFFFKNFLKIHDNFYLRLIKMMKHKKDSLVLTNVSSLGKELLGMNFKVLFYSFITFRMQKDYYDKSSNFCCLQKDKDELLKKINSLKKLNLNQVTKKKKLTKKSFLSFDPNIKKFKYFLSLSGLKVKKNLDFKKI